MNVIALLGSEIDRNLELYDLSLEAVVDGMKLPALTELSPEMRQLVLFDRAATAKDMGSIFVLGPDGTVVYDSQTLKPTPENHAQRDYFQQWRLHSHRTPNRNVQALGYFPGLQNYRATERCFGGWSGRSC